MVTKTALNLSWLFDPDYSDKYWKDYILTLCTHIFPCEYRNSKIFLYERYGN